MTGLQVLTGDCRDILSTLAAGSVQCCVSSPPYWGLRDYGIDLQLGLEATPQEYIANMVAVFREVWRVLRDDGTLWLNLGDSYAGSSNGDNKSGLAKFSELCDGHKRYPENHASFRGDMHGFERPKAVKCGFKPKDLCMMPARLAMALQADGWYLRSEIVWHKPNPMPESVTDRPTKAHEMIYLLAKQERYFYDAEAIREEAEYGRRSAFRSHSYENNISMCNGSERGANVTINGSDPSAGRNKRTVWTIATQPYSEAHFATFPEEIPKLCILVGSKPGDLVLDPFAGSGTVGKVALELGRRAILIELNPDYIQLARNRTFVTLGFF